MKDRTLICGAVVVLLLVAVPAMTQDYEDQKSGWCSPVGTWQGMNEPEGVQYIVTIERSMFGRYTVVAEGLAYPDAIENTSWHANWVRTGPMTFTVRQLMLYRSPDPSPVPNPEGIVLLGAGEGEIVLTSCDHFEVDFDLLGFYAWRPGVVPFVDPFDYHYIPPEPPSHGEYDRMPLP